VIEVDDFDTVVHDGKFGVTTDHERMIVLADVETMKNRADDDIAELLP